MNHPLSTTAERAAFVQESVAESFDQRNASRPRCMYDVYLSIERSIDELASIACRSAKHSAKLKVQLETLERVKGRVQQARRA